MTLSSSPQEPEREGLVFGRPGRPDPRISFEFFPPKTDAAAEQLMETVRRLAPLGPAFLTVTYGAGGTTRDRTFDTVTAIARETKLPTASHLTAVGAPTAEVDEVARRLWDAGIRHVVALRGDMPGGGAYEPHPQGYAYAVDLVAGLKRIADFEISVAAYPEVHPTAPSAEFDLDNLKRKVDAGASRAISQFFFDAASFLRFRDRAVSAGVAVPIVPGILPIASFERTRQFAASCGAAIPDWLALMFEGLDDDPDTRQLVAATVAAEQCRILQHHGVDDFHFYTLNRAELTLAVCRSLHIRPRSRDEVNTKAPRRSTDLPVTVP